MKKLSYLFAWLLMAGFIFTSCEREYIPVESISIYPVEFSMTPNIRTITLTATILPENATRQAVTWKSYNLDIATVDANGVVTAISGGDVVISATTRPTRDGYLRALSRITVEHNISFPIEGVVIDGVRWATRNVGAPGTFVDRPEDFGMFFQWNTRTGWSSTNPMIASDGSTTWNSTVVNPTFIEWERANDPCPEGWRIPNREELEVLANTGIWTTQNGVRGYLVGTAPNQIFLPMAGLRDRFEGTLGTGSLVYWSRTQTNATGRSWSLRSFQSWPPANAATLSDWESHSSALSVRCVADTNIDIESISLNKTTLTLPVGSIGQLEASILPSNATNKNVLWRSSNPTVATVDATGKVTARIVGTTTISVLTEDGGKIATCAVTVEEATVSGSLEGVVIDGVRWATRNVDAPGTFAASPESAGMLYQWNRRLGWSSTDPLVNSEGGTEWDRTIAQGSEWTAINDPCPAGWRLPTYDELSSLLNVGVNIWTIINNVEGRIFGTAPNQIFLPAANQRSGIWGGLHRGGWDPGGYYWSSSVRIENSNRYAYFLSFTINDPHGVSRGGIFFDARSVRCVAIE